MNFNILNKEIDKNLKHFGFLDSFSIKKREMLLKDAEKIISLISTNTATAEQIQELKKLNLKLIKKLEGKWFSNLCLKIISGNQLNILNSRASLVRKTIKKIDKLLNLNVKPNQLGIFLDQKKGVNNLNQFLFEDHIYERMKFFNHNFSFNDRGELTFKFTEILPLVKEISENPIASGKIGSYWEELYKKFKEKKITLEILKDDLRDVQYRLVPISDITPLQLKEIILRENGSFNKNINVIYPSKDLTVKELLEKSVLVEDEDSHEYLINPEFQYLENGFIKSPHSHWRDLKPFMSIPNPPKDFTIDIIVHSKPGLPGIFEDQGHASIKMTTPKGEVYSVGLYPEDSERHPLDFSLQKGTLITPDNYLFMPSSSYEQHVLTYTLSDPKAFQKLIKWLESLQGYNKNVDTGEIIAGNLFYHSTHQSCASFAGSFRDYAIELGAKSQKLSKHKISNLSKVEIKFKEFLLNLFLHSFIGREITEWHKGIKEYAGIKDYNIRHLSPKSKPYLPIDLIIEHSEIKDKDV